MKLGKVIFREKLVVGYWDLIPMESGVGFLAPQDTATVRVEEERPAAKKQRNHLWTKDNWPRLKETLVNSRYPYLRGKCDEACLVLGLDTYTKQTIFNLLQRIGMKTITYENALPMKNMALLSENQVKYVEDIIVKRDTTNLGISRKEAIQFMSELGQENSFVQA